jgi:hypothetical protein
MRELTETAELSLDPAATECLNRTRSGVLNVLIGVGAIVALSGLVLRGREVGAWFPFPERVNQGMFLALGLIFVVSTILRRILGSRTRLRDPQTRGTRFYWGHVVPAVVGALAAVLGFAYGWLVSPRLEAILPFWLGALVLGVLAYPRGRELEDFDGPMTFPGGSAR